MGKDAVLFYFFFKYFLYYFSIFACLQNVSGIPTNVGLNSVIIFPDAYPSKQKRNQTLL